MTTALASAAPSTFGHNLNPAQLRAATFRYPTDSDPNRGAASGPLLIVAGAGTGKTNTLAHRVAFLLLQRVPPERIALLTFTRRAAQEMLQRAERIAQQRSATRRDRRHSIRTRRARCGRARFIRSAIGCCASTRTCSESTARSP